MWFENSLQTLPFGNLQVHSLIKNSSATLLGPSSFPRGNGSLFYFPNHVRLRDKREANHAHRCGIVLYKSLRRLRVVQSRQKS